MLATSPENGSRVPILCFASARPIYKLLLLLCSMMNRILNSERCRLLHGHTRQLTQLAVEGPGLRRVCQIYVMPKSKRWQSSMSS